MRAERSVKSLEMSANDRRRAPHLPRGFSCIPPGPWGKMHGILVMNRLSGVLDNAAIPTRAPRLCMLAYVASLVRHGHDL